MLWTGRISGGPASSMPSFSRIGISRWPNASNFASDSHISLTRNTPSASKATWYCMPSGGHGPDASIFGMTSSYFFAFMLGADVKRAKMLMSFSPDPEPRAPYPRSKRSSPTRNGARSSPVTAAVSTPCGGRCRLTPCRVAFRRRDRAARRGLLIRERCTILFRATRAMKIPANWRLVQKPGPEGGRHLLSQLAKTSGRYGRITARPDNHPLSGTYAPAESTSQRLRRRLRSEQQPPAPLHGGRWYQEAEG